MRLLSRSKKSNGAKRIRLPQPTWPLSKRPLLDGRAACSAMGVAKLTEQNTVVPESKYARIERERRYLLQDLPEDLSRADPHLQITDNYITGTRLRLRKVREPRTNKWTVKFTQKFAANDNDFSRTIITNTYLNAIEAETLSLFNANEIRKNRYRFEFAGREFA